MARKRRTITAPVSASQPTSSMRWLIANLVLLTAILVFGLLTAWLIQSPEQRLLEFLDAWKVIAPVSGVVTFLFAVWALVLGKDPKAWVLRTLRENIKRRLVRRSGALKLSLVVQVIVLAMLAGAWVNLYRAAPSSLKMALWGEFDRSDTEIKAKFGIDCPDEQAAAGALAQMRPIAARFVCAVNDAVYQRSRVRNRAADSSRCREVFSILADGARLSDSLWERYARHFGIAACLTVAQLPKQAVDELRRAKATGKRLWPGGGGSEFAQAHASVAISATYLDSAVHLLGVNDSGERASLAASELEAATKLSHSDDETLLVSLIAMRMLGGIEYERGDLTAADSMFRDALRTVPSDRPGPYSGFELEKVRLANNLGYMRLQSGRTTEAVQAFEAALDTAKRLDTRINSQRREKVRLLSNMSIALSSLGQCQKALAVATERAGTLKEKSAQCPALLDLTVLSCQIVSSGTGTPLKQQFLNRMACALTPAECRADSTVLIEDVDKAMKALQSAFAGCYAAVEFPIDRIRKSLDLVQQR